MHPIALVVFLLLVVLAVMLAALLSSSCPVTHAVDKIPIYCIVFPVRYSRDFHPDHEDRCRCHELGRYAIGKIGLSQPGSPRVLTSGGSAVSRLLRRHVYLDCS